jgi:hypothetical protein
MDLTNGKILVNTKDQQIIFNDIESFCDYLKNKKLKLNNKIIIKIIEDGLPLNFDNKVWFVDWAF